MNKKVFLIIFFVSLLISFIGWKVYVERTTNNNTISLYGNVDIRDVSLSFRVSGRITKVFHEEGDVVKKDQILALLEQDTFEDDLNMAKAELVEAKAAYNNDESVYQRSIKLLKKNVISQSEFDQAVSKRDQSYAHIQIVKARIEKAQTALDDTIIKAPSDGIILLRIREPGAIVQAGQPIYSLAVNDLVWVRTYVSEPQLGLVYPGQLAKIYTDSKPNQPYIGQIGFISPQAEFTPKNVETTELRTDLVYRLRVIIKNPDENLRQGMPVTVILKYKNE